MTVAIVAMVLYSCQKDTTPRLQALRGNAFGTTYTIQYFSVQPIDIEKGVDSVIYRVNKSVSTYLPSSDISKINKGDSTLVIDEIFKEVYVISKDVYAKTGGYFDPTVGVLRNAYGFGDDAPLKEIDEHTLDSLRQYVGFTKISIRDNGTISKQFPEIYIDFNAIAKGYGIDLIGAYLKSRGIKDFVVELGGEVLASGLHQTKNKPWVAGVEGINSGVVNRSAIATVALSNKAMAGSGNYRKYRIDSVTGKKYVHTMNPLTGKAEENNLTSATVIANSCVVADAYATSFMAMGLINSKRLIKELPDVEAYFTYQSKRGEAKEFISAGFYRLINQ